MKTYNSTILKAIDLINENSPPMHWTTAAWSRSVP